MQERLYPNIKRMNAMFCAGIVLITFAALISRLTFLSGMAVEMPSGLISGVVDTDEGSSDADYTINSKIYFSAPDAKGNILITNKETNPNYIRVDVRLDDGGRSVYYSGDIAPGTPVNSVRLQGSPLEEGVYECTAYITAYDPQTKDKLGEEKIPVTLYIGIKPEKTK